MDIKKFWQIIEKANKNTNHDITLVNENVFEQLVQLENPDIVIWKQIFDEYYSHTNGNQMHVAFYIIEGNFSEEAFDSYRAGLISSGEKIYLQTLENPDSLVAHDFVDDGTLFNTAFLHVAEYAYLQKNGVTEKKFDDLVANTIISGTLKKEIFDSIEFSYKMDKEWEDDESSLMKLCPKLFAEFW